jgi:hypothetical protein
LLGQPHRGRADRNQQGKSNAQQDWLDRKAGNRRECHLPYKDLRFRDRNIVCVSRYGLGHKQRKIVSIDKVPMELFASQDLRPAARKISSGPEIISAKTARTAFTLESRPHCVAREGNATSAYRCRNGAARSARTTSGGVSARRYAKAG